MRATAARNELYSFCIAGIAVHERRDKPLCFKDQLLGAGRGFTRLRPVCRQSSRYKAFISATRGSVLKPHR